jgi:hypothetical protein
MHSMSALSQGLDISRIIAILLYGWVVHIVEDALTSKAY